MKNLEQKEIHGRALVRQWKDKTLICLVVPKQVDSEAIDCVTDLSVLITKGEVGNDKRIGSYSYGTILRELGNDNFLIKNADKELFASSDEL